MRILAIADVEDELLCARLEGRASSLDPVDLVISCGDLPAPYLDYVATMTGAPLAYVRGNHDQAYGQDPPGGIDLDGRVVRLGRLRIAGLEGSLRYREGIVAHTQAQMWVRSLFLEARTKLSGGIDLLVTHVPPRGHGDLNDLPHQGFDAFNWLLGRVRPSHMLSGHVHLDYGRVPRARAHPSGTLLVNAFGHVELEL